ncbi:MAG: apolipoprotein N-acyltransferase, partial [Acidimicrobiia bacterium]|nr:apolipoprotein N-acyltransferase [Acidimicrobiia bacterium]
MPPPASSTRGGARSGDVARARPGARGGYVAGGLGCVASGLAIAAAMPPWGWWPLAIAGFAGLDRLLAGRGLANRLLRGWLVGAAWLYPSTFWMLDFSAPAYLVAGALLGAYLGVACLLVPPGPARHLALPGVVALAELVRWSVPFGGVPLSTVPMSQAAAPLAPVARLGGGLALTLATVALGAAAAALWERARREGRGRGRRGRDRGRGTAGLAVPVGLVGSVGVALLVAAVLPRAEEVGRVEVALVQGGGPQRTRAATTDQGVVFARHLDASSLIRTPVDLVVWPENVVNVDLPLPSVEEGRALSELARRLDATLVAGVVESLGPDAFANYSVVVDPDGAFGDRYDKVQRVPFGEYVPFRSVMAPLSGGLIDRYVPKDAVQGSSPAVVQSPVGTLGVLISWEVFFERRARDALTHGAEVLLNPTNGSSYWLTIVQSQQVASSRLRALETDRWVLQASPTGFSAFVGPDGDVLERTGVSEQRVLQRTIGRRDGMTIASRFGPWPWLGLALALVTAAKVLAARSLPGGGGAGAGAGAEGAR